MHKQAYISFATSTSGLPIFMQPWWLDTVASADGWDAIVSNDEHGNVAGAWAFARHKIMGLRALVLPPMTPFTGIWIRIDPELPSHKQDIQRQGILADLEAKLPKVPVVELKVHWPLQDWAPFYWAGYRQETRYTFRFPDPDPEAILDNVSKSFRRNLRAAERTFEIQKSNDPSILAGLVEKVFEIRGNAMPFNTDKIKSTFEAVASRNTGQLYYAFDESGNPVSAILVVWDDSTTYYLLGGRKDSHTQNSTNLLIMRAIEDAATRGHAFDFEGSMIQGVHRFFQSFGAEMQPYMLLYKYRGLARVRYLL